MTNNVIAATIASRMAKPVTRASTSETARRVEHIADMMRHGEWLRGRSAPILAKDWGVETNTVEKLSAEASRIVARDVTDPEKLKVDVASVLVANLHRASADGEYKAVASLGDVVTRIVGARAPEKQEITFSEEQAKAKFRELVAKYPELAGK